MGAENICRHVLGIEYVGKYKAEALREYCAHLFPLTKILPWVSKAEELIEDEGIDLNDYDMIISATGNHNFNRWLNGKVHQKGIKTPCIYLWNEPFDVGCHLAVIYSDRKGCYECFFDRNEETNELYDVTAYTKPGRMVTGSNRGCAGSFVPYSSNMSLNVVSACLVWMERILLGRCDKNVLVSIKGDAYIFTKEGYECSDVFYKQNEKEKATEGEAFQNGGCKICGRFADGD